MKPALAKIRPGRPAPAIGPGTAAAADMAPNSPCVSWSIPSVKKRVSGLPPLRQYGLWYLRVASRGFIGDANGQESRPSAFPPKHPVVADQPLLGRALHETLLSGDLAVLHGAWHRVENRLSCRKPSRPLPLLSRQYFRNCQPTRAPTLLRPKLRSSTLLRDHGEPYKRPGLYSD
jgi:hypothetical protein